MKVKSTQTSSSKQFIDKTCKSKQLMKIILVIKMQKIPVTLRIFLHEVKTFKKNFALKTPLLILIPTLLRTKKQSRGGVI